MSKAIPLISLGISFSIVPGAGRGSYQIVDGLSNGLCSWCMADKHGLVAIPASPIDELLARDVGEGLLSPRLDVLPGVSVISRF